MTVGSLPAAPLPLPNAKNLRTLGDFYFRRVGEKFVVSNDWGHHAFLSDAEMRLFIEGGLPPDSPLYLDLAAKGFVRDRANIKELAQSFAKHNKFLWAGPCLHIVVVTLRCNLKCVYCHSSVVEESQTQFDMTLETAKKTVDFIFQSPNQNLTLEFQGGEPLMNWPAIKFICSYARKLSKKTKRSLKLLMVSNFTLMTEEKLKFLLDNGVSVCTSLDGPAHVHDRNRIRLGGNNHAATTFWLQRIRELKGSAGALMTTTRLSLQHGPEIIDEYVRLGLSEVFLRPLHYLGFAKRSWEAIGYTDHDFIKFYRGTMEHVFSLNARGIAFRESTAMLLLRKILQHQDPGYVDLRSPCGATLGQVSYNYNGEVYTCDEGRMLAVDNDHTFRVGNVHTGSYNDAVDHPNTRACAVSSTLDGQPLCNTCAYKPYCGICPVLNYATQNSIWGQMPTNSYCYDFMHIFDYLFEQLQNPDRRRVLEGWLGMSDPIVKANCAGQL